LSEVSVKVRHFLRSGLKWKL